MFDTLDMRMSYTHGGAAHRAAVHFNSLRFDVQSLSSRSIVLHRDPRDTVVPGFFQTKFRLDGYEGTMSDFFRDPHHGLKKVITFNLGWSDAVRDRSGVRVISYEALRQDTVGGMSELLAFLQVKRARDRIDRAVSECTFEKMRAAEATSGFDKSYGEILSPKDPSNPESFKVRKGKVGGFVDYLTREDVEYCDGVLRELDYFARMGVVITQPSTA